MPTGGRDNPALVSMPSYHHKRQMIFGDDEVPLVTTTGHPRLVLTHAKETLLQSQI